MPKNTFIRRMKEKDQPSVLELGTRRVNPAVSTMRRRYVPHAAEYVGTDFRDGLDVDVIADVHELSGVFGENRFDAVISCSTFEHLRYPWIAVVEINRVLRPGGLVFVQTHQTFPLHAHPHDYFRFSRDGLEALFAEQVGFQTVLSAHNFRCAIVSTREPRTALAPAYLNSLITVEKVAHAGPDFRWKNVPGDSAITGR